jgi:hypothetical protein
MEESKNACNDSVIIAGVSVFPVYLRKILRS